MKKFFITSLLALIFAFSTLTIGCSGKESSQSSENSSSSNVESVDDSSSQSSKSDESEDTVDGDFIWTDGQRIVNLSEEGANKSEIIIPENCLDLNIKDLTSGNDNLFTENYNLESIVFESENIKHLPKGFLSKNSNLKTVQLPKNLKEIPEWLFAYCSSLETVEIPDSVTEIKDYAFQHSNIKELKLPESVTTVGSSIFQGTKIEKLYLPESLTSINNSFLSFIDDVDDPNYKLTIYVKKGSYADEHFDDYSRKSSEKAYY